MLPDTNLAGEKTVEGKEHIVTGNRTGSGRGGRAGANTGKIRRSDILNSKGLDLFAKLRELRTKLAKQEGVPPYVIFSDKTLVELCIKLPQTEKELLSVSGIGEYKAEKYGDAFLKSIEAFTGGERQKMYFGEGKN